MYNFFVNSDQFQNEEVEILGDDAKHISNVLRMKKGEQIYICNRQNAKKYLAELESFQKESIIAKIIKEMKNTEPVTQITLFQGIPKTEKMEYIIQKTVELGIYEIVPVEMKYCIAKIKDPDKKIERWQKISEAAAKQSKRNIIPKISMPQDISKIHSRFKEYDLIMVAYENESKDTIKKVINENKQAKKIAIIVGPEGGISDTEVEKLISLGAKATSLGKQILRTETAPLAMISMIMYEYEM